MRKIKLAITEEYGYREWVAYLTKTEYDSLLARWSTLRGLNCLVPVQLVVPKAEITEDFEDINLWALQAQGAKRCHFHECDDSHLEGSDYQIPEAENFWMDGKEYTPEEIHQARDKEMEYLHERHY